MNAASSAKPDLKLALEDLQHAFTGGSNNEYVEYYNKLLKRKASGSHILMPCTACGKYIKLFGLKCPLSANPTIPVRRNSRMRICSFTGSTTKRPAAI